MARPKRKSPTPAKRTASTPQQLRIRMYRHGLGDCFLLTVPDAKGQPFHIMIDCGVILGTKNINDRLGAVLDDVIKTTGGNLDVLVVTHEHYDHVAAFSRLPEKFAEPGTSEPGKLSVQAVWFAWTEDPLDKLGKLIRTQRAARKEALAGLLGRLDRMGAAAAAPSAVPAALSFFGIDEKGQDTGEGIGATAQAMINAAGFAPRDSIHYWKPGEIWTSDAVPAIRIHVLGPPRDEKALRKTDSTVEVYHLDAGSPEASVRMSAADGGDARIGGPYSPFEGPYRRKLSDLRSGSAVDPLATFLAENYWDARPVTPDGDRSWRRIDDIWLGSAEQLALALDSATNNTSLALAIELTGSRDVLLFPADAQVGNWLSWHDIKWENFTTADLLCRTRFYKVGHHGSHNATLKTKGLEMMPEKGMVAFIPVDQEMAKQKRWFEMPLDHLLDALKERCGDGVVRIDKDLPAGLTDVTAGGTGGPYDTLYYDWTCDCREHQDLSSGMDYGHIPIYDKGR
jgi:hypothetical protein